jgi:four helix bundle protein
MHKLENLKIWTKAIELAKDVYEITSKYPTEEKYGLISQMRRCSVSIPSNIAEGAGRKSNKEFSYFLSISNGSAFELQTQLIISNKLDLINKDDFEKLLKKTIEIQKMNYGLNKVNLN